MSRLLHRAAPLAAALLTATTSACATHDPYANTQPPATPTLTAARSGPATEGPDDLTADARPIPAPAAASHAAASPEQAARRYATLSVNWSWRTYAAQQRQLTALARGRTLVQAELDALFDVAPAIAPEHRAPLESAFAPPRPDELEPPTP